MALSDLLHRITSKFSGTQGNSSAHENARAIDEGDPTRTIVTDNEPAPIEGK